MLAGTALDVLEIDAASNRGIDEIRALREAVKFAPATMRMKVYIIDEAHMLTKEGANAFLKTLEEPPPHAVFILATTEPEKAAGNHSLAMSALRVPPDRDSGDDREDEDDRRGGGDRRSTTMRSPPLRTAPTADCATRSRCWNKLAAFAGGEADHRRDARPRLRRDRARRRRSALVDAIVARDAAARARRHRRRRPTPAPISTC